MPITEVVRALVVLRSETGEPWELAYDTDGAFGTDERAIGWPRFWLRGPDAVLGPFDDEMAALDAAAARGLAQRA